MKALATKARTLQFVAHSGHNLVEGRSFYGDHAALGELYGTYTKLYDLIIERMISVGETTQPLEITVAAAQEAAGVGETKDPDQIFGDISSLEIELRGLCSKYLDQNEGVTPGIKNLVEQIASDSEDRSYKIDQRLANVR